MKNLRNYLFYNTFKMIINLFILARYKQSILIYFHYHFINTNDNGALKIIHIEYIISIYIHERYKLNVSNNIKLNMCPYSSLFRMLNLIF